MTSQVVKIAPGAHVTMHFSLNLDSGEVIDSTNGKEPAQFVVGEGALPAGIEKLLIGLHNGTQRTIDISPEHAFGQYNENNVHIMKKSNFNHEIVLEVGTIVYFSDPSQKEIPGVIKSITDDTVKVDFNHPLAGLNLKLDVNIIKVSLEQR